MGGDAAEENEGGRKKGEGKKRKEAKRCNATRHDETRSNAATLDASRSVTVETRRICQGENILPASRCKSGISREAKSASPSLAKRESRQNDALTLKRVAPERISMALSE